MNDQAAKLRQMAHKTITKAQKPLLTRGRSIAVTSGKGGAGKTNLVVNLAVVLGRLGYQVIIFDADVGMANADILLGLYPKFTIIDVVRGEKRLEDIVMEGPMNVRVVPGGNGLEDLAAYPDLARQRLINALEELESSADFLLVDTGAGASKNILRYIGAAREVIVVVTPEPTSLTDAYSIIKLINRAKLQETVQVVVNQARSLEEGAQAFTKLNSVAIRFLHTPLTNLGQIGEDPLVPQAVREQTPFVLTHPNAPASRQVELIAQKLAGMNPKTSESFWGKLSRFFSAGSSYE